MRARHGPFSQIINITRSARKYIAILDREPIGLNLVGKLTNFHAHSSIPHASLYQEIDVCQAVTGGCCQGGGHENETPELS